jgi:hypothetical protein
MMRFARGATHWVARHAFPAIAATVIAVGAAGGGIGFAVASQHTTAAPTSSTSGSTAPAHSPAASGHRATAAGRASQLLQGALGMLATQTGQSVASVRSQLAAGKSVDDIAGAKAPAIEGEILAAITKLADRAVGAGKITSTQEAAGLALAKTKVEALMAEPGTQLLKDAQQALQFLQGRGIKHTAPPATATPTPAA